MAKPSGQSYGNFQQGGYLSIHTTAIWRQPEHSSTSDRPKKTAPWKEDQWIIGNGIHMNIIVSLLV